MKISKIVSLPALLIASMTAAQAQIIISEVDPTGSSTTTYAADWFELKNTGASAVDITGWKMDDNSDDFTKAVPLTGVTSIAPGLAVVFIEDTGMTDSTLDGTFISTWFGGNAPAGLTIGNYGGSGVGLGSGGDAVNIFNSAGVLQADVTFGAATTGDTFDNEAGVNGAISQLSATGLDGAFSDGTETGSPGDVAPAPEPATLALAGLGLTGLIAFRRHNRKA